MRRSGSPRAAAEAPVWRLCCFLASVAIVLVALVSPLDSLADQLFFVHMIQHMLLLDVGADPRDPRPHEGDPAPGHARRSRRSSAAPALLAHPAFAVVLYVGVIWAWHVPAAYDFAVRHPAVHVLEHLSFLVAGSLYWWHLLSPIRARLRLDGMGRSSTWPRTKLFVGALGMGLAFAPSALYPYYVHHARVWGISAHRATSRSPA